MPARVCIPCAVLLAATASAQPPAPLVTFKGHTDPVYAVAASPDGRLAATGSFDKTVKLWSLADGKELRTFGGPLGHQSLVLSVAFSPTGEALASGGSDNAARVWDVPPTAPARETPTSAPCGALAVSPDGKSIAVGGEDGKTRIRSAADGKSVAELAGGGKGVEALAFHPNGSQVFAAATDGSLRGWELPSGKSLGAVEIGVATGLVVTGKHVVAVAADGTLTAVPLPLDPKAKPKTAKAGGPLVALPNAADVIAGGAVWNVGDMKPVRALDAVGPASAYAVLRNGQVLAAAGGPGEGAVRFVNLADGRPLGSFKPPAVVRGLAAHPGGKLLLGRLASGEAAVWNVAFEPGQPLPAEFGSVVQSMPHKRPLAGVGFALDGTRAVTGTADGVVREWKLASDQPKKLDHPNIVDAVAFSPADANLLATACHDGKVRLFDVAKGAATKTIDAHVTPKPEPVYAVAFRPDGKRFASASYDQSIKIWDAATGALVREIKPGRDAANVPANAGAVGGVGAVALKSQPPSRGHRDQVFCIAFSPDGTRLASGSSDRTVKVWDADTGALVRDFPNPAVKASGEPASHPGFVHAVRFADGGKKLVSAGTAPRNLGYLMVWDVATGKPVAGGDTPVGPVYAVEPTANGLLIGCGPRVRTEPAADAHVVRVPGK